MTEYLFSEDARLRRHARDLPHAVPVELIDHRIQILAVGAYLLEQWIELGVKAREKVGRDHPLDDHGAVLVEAVHDLFGRRAGGQPRNVSAHIVTTSRNPRLSEAWL